MRVFLLRAILIHVCLTYTICLVVVHWARTVPKKCCIPGTGELTSVAPHVVLKFSVDIQSSKLACKNAGGSIPTSLKPRFINRFTILYIGHVYLFNIQCILRHFIL